MKYIIDTSTWVSLVRYYKPFDFDSVIYKFFKDKIDKQEFILLSEVSSECSFVAKKIVVEELDYILSKDCITKTSDILPSKKFYNLLENQFSNSFQRRQLEDYEIESLTNDFIKSADARIIMKAMNDIKLGGKTTVVTEETTATNDNKLFKKIPSICSALEIKCITLPNLIKIFDKELLIEIKNTSA